MDAFVSAEKTSGHKVTYANNKLTVETATLAKLQAKLANETKLYNYYKSLGLGAQVQTLIVIAKKAMDDLTVQINTQLGRVMIAKNAFLDAQNQTPRGKPRGMKGSMAVT